MAASTTALLLLTAAALLLPGSRGAAPPPPTEPAEPDWDNEPHQELFVHCPSGYALHSVQSEYIPDDPPQPPDRLWDWECKKISDGLVREQCDGFPINQPEGPMIARCPKRWYMTGVIAFFTGTDRFWIIVCCESAGLICPDECFLSESINQPGEDFSYCAKEDSVFVGLVSSYDETLNDRVWRIEECRASKCQLYPGIELEKKSTEEDDYPQKKDHRK